MKKLAAVAALSLVAVSTAYATGPGQPGISASGYVGTISGTVSSVSTGTSVVSTQINGYGSSSQTSFGETGGVATAGIVQPGWHDRGHQHPPIRHQRDLRSHPRQCADHGRR